MGTETYVFVVSSNRLLRESLTRILRKTDFRVFAADQLAPGIKQEILSSEACVLLLDSASPLFGDTETTNSARFSKSLVRIVLFGMDEDPAVFLQAVRRGVVGYVLKDASAAELVNSIRGVVRGEAVCPPTLCRSLFEYVARHMTQVPRLYPPLRLGLSRREQQLLPLIARGLTNKEIAVEFHLSEQTVKNHVHRILTKLGAQHRLEIAETCRGRGVEVLPAPNTPFPR